MELQDRLGTVILEAIKKEPGRVAQAFDLAGISNTMGAPSFAVFAKGGSRECLCKWVDHATRSRNEISVQPSFTRTGPASSKR
jgi:hypothetical protein